MLELVRAQPLIAVLVTIVALTIVVTFIFPLFAKVTQTTFWDLLEHRLTKTKASLKNHPVQTLALLVIFVLVLAGGYFFYQSFQSVRTLSAAEFKSQRGKELAILNSEGSGSWEKAGFYLVDVRSRDEFRKIRIKGSINSPKQTAEKEFVKVRNSVYLFSASDRQNEPKEVAKEIIKKRKALGEKGKNLGNIYIVKDGIEGLEKLDLTTETGEPAQ